MKVRNRQAGANGQSAVVTRKDLDRLTDLMRSPGSRIYGSMSGLEAELRQSSVVAPDSVGKDVVTMNSRVRVRDLDTGDREIYTLVYPAEADIDEGRISVLAPLGAALLGARERQVVTCATPRGERRLKVERVLYQPEAAGDFHL